MLLKIFINDDYEKAYFKQYLSLTILPQIDKNYLGYVSLSHSLPQKKEGEISHQTHIHKGEGPQPLTDTWCLLTDVWTGAQM